MYGYGSHFEKRLRERFGWDWDELKVKSRGLKMESFKTSHKLENRFKGFGEKIRNNETTIFIVEQLDILIVRVGLEWKTCYRMYGN